MRQNKRTKPTRANIGGSPDRMLDRLERGATRIGALHEVNPPGSKCLRKIRRAHAHCRLSARQRIIAHRHRGRDTMKEYWRAR